MGAGSRRGAIRDVQPLHSSLTATPSPPCSHAHPLLPLPYILVVLVNPSRPAPAPLPPLPTLHRTRTARLWDAACAQPLLEISHLHHQPPARPTGPGGAPAMPPPAPPSPAAAAKSPNPPLQHEVCVIVCAGSYSTTEVARARVTCAQS